MVKFNELKLFQLFMIVFLIINDIYAEPTSAEIDCLDKINKVFEGCKTALDCLKFALKKLRKFPNELVLVTNYTEHLNIGNIPEYEEVRDQFIPVTNDTNSKAWKYFDYLLLYIAPGPTMQNQAEYCNSIVINKNSKRSSNKRFLRLWVYKTVKNCYDAIINFGESLEDIVANVFLTTKRLGNNGINEEGLFIDWYLMHIVDTCVLKVINNKEASNPKAYCNSVYEEKNCLDETNKLFEGCNVPHGCLRFALRNLRKPVNVVENSKAWDYFDYLILFIATGPLMENQEKFCKTLANHEVYTGNPIDLVNKYVKICHDAIQFFGSKCLKDRI